DFALEIVLKHAPGAVRPLAGRHADYALIELTSPDPEAPLGAKLEAVLADAIEAGFVGDAVIGASEAQNRSLWHLRESISEFQKAEGASIKHDVSVPVGRVAEFIETASAACRRAMPGVRVCPF